MGSDSTERENIDIVRNSPYIVLASPETNRINMGSFLHISQNTVSQEP